MDNFDPQGGDIRLRVGHEERELNVRGVVLFIIILVVSAVLTLLLAWALMEFFEWAERKYFDQPPSAAQQQLQEQRGERAGKEQVKPQSDLYDREVDEKVLNKTFAAPRLQYDDAADMERFRKAEDQWLQSAARNRDGSIHIPIDQAIDLVSKSGLPAVNGTFTPQPMYGSLESEAEAARRRVSQEGGQPQQPRKK